MGVAGTRRSANSLRSTPNPVSYYGRRQTWNLLSTCKNTRHVNRKTVGNSRAGGRKPTSPVRFGSFACSQTRHVGSHVFDEGPCDDVRTGQSHWGEDEHHHDAHNAAHEAALAAERARMEQERQMFEAAKQDLQLEREKLHLEAQKVFMRAGLRHSLYLSCGPRHVVGSTRLPARGANGIHASGRLQVDASSGRCSGQQTPKSRCWEHAGHCLVLHQPPQTAAAPLTHSRLHRC